MQIFALFMFLGFCFSWLIPETNGKTLEELSGENEDDGLGRQYEKDEREPENEAPERAETRSRVDQVEISSAKVEELGG